MPAATILGWDLGGAHLKVAALDPLGRVIQATQIPCPLWQGLRYLDDALDKASTETGKGVKHHAVTMTGELVDLFRNREEGVAKIAQAAVAELPGKIEFWAGEQGFVTPQATTGLAHRIASANWLASAVFAARRVRAGIFLDIGSTTTDIVALNGGKPCYLGYSDHERLAHGELVYRGVVRTPVMAVINRAPFAGAWQALVAEQFATMADVYRLTGDLPEYADQAPTCDGAGKSEAESARRLARMLGRDAECAPPADWRELAAFVAQTQFEEILSACKQALERHGIAPDVPVVGAGVGRFLARKLAASLGRDYVDFGSLVESSLENKEWTASCAPAVAVAWLALNQ